MYDSPSHVYSVFYYVYLRKNSIITTVDDKLILNNESLILVISVGIIQ